MFSGLGWVFLKIEFPFRFLYLCFLCTFHKIFSFQQLYPVPEIIRGMKIGKRLKESPEALITRLLALDAKDFTSEDRTQIHKAVGPWLMSNAKRSLFTLSS